jgi:large conductance mechanosensitive channel
MGMMQEFKEFALKGNVVDLAVGVVIGAAFGKIVTSMVDDIVMPLVGLLGNANFENSFVILSNPTNADKATLTTVALAKAAKCNVLAYGNFVTVVVNFLIVAFCIFIAVKQMNKLSRAASTAAKK